MSSPSYGAVLGTPLVRSAFAASLVGRLSYGAVPLSLMLAVNGAAGSYAVAGTALALFGAASVVLSPARAALVDRYGTRRALPPMAGVYAVLLTLLARETWRPGAASWWLVALSVAAGCCTPPMGPVMRALWSGLLTDRDLLRRAYSLDAVSEELLYVGGPLLVGLLVVHTGPAVGLALAAGLVLAGALTLAHSPAVRAAEGRAVRGEEAGERADGAVARSSPLRVAGLRHAMTVMAGVGLGLGAMDLLVVAFAQDRPQAAAQVLAALSAGSAVGGLAHGALATTDGGRTRAAVLTGAFGAALAVAGLSPHVIVLMVVAAVAGLFVSPVLTTAYLLADASVPDNARTRAGAWANTAFNAGSSLGSAGAGLCVDRLPTTVCFALAALPALGAAVAVAGGSRGRAPAGKGRTAPAA
ncbi:MFS transporter [Streptomyces sp. NBC_01218]|uniref:MFS transporter n=1 Tax=Streptomyces sp. NBC_01218 TaxID=2903780 RepID=UPI002E121DBC|nr:MFS transporter [Streptomyces sp. NBC_01218]